MTANQINYYKAREDFRSHTANEALKGQELAIAARNADTNAMNAATNAAAVAESARANRAREQIDSTKINNDFLANVQKQGTESAKVTESARHNVATESQASNELRFKQAANEVNVWKDIGLGALNAAGRVAGLLIR